MANILLLFLSKLPEKTKTDKDQITFVDDAGREFSGIYTNDAPAKSIMSLLKSADQQLDRIICATSPEAMEGAFDKYSQMIADYALEQGMSMPEIVSVQWDRDDHVLKVTADILAHIVSAERQPQDHRQETGRVAGRKGISSMEDALDEDIHIYFDATGGFRSANYALLFVVRFLEYSGIKCKKVVYATYPAPYRIEDLNDVYKMFDLINAADSFTSYGNAGKLKDFYAGNGNQEIRKLIEAMNEFSEAIGLCDIARLDDILINFNRALDDFKSGASASDRLFSSIIDVIKQKFAITEENEIDYMHLIEWCIDNNLLQQALTIYTEKIPVYLYEKGYFIINNPDIKKNLKESKVVNWQESHLNDQFQLFWDGFFRLWDGSLVDTKGGKRRSEKNSVSRNQVIRKLPDLLEEQRHSRNYRLPDWLSANEMQEILVNYLYIKNYIRNRANHAGGNDAENDRNSINQSSNSKGSNSQEGLFKKYNYTVVNTDSGTTYISAGAVSESLRRGIELIKKDRKKAGKKRKNNIIIVRS